MRPRSVEVRRLFPLPSVADVTAIKCSISVSPVCYVTSAAQASSHPSAAAIRALITGSICRFARFLDGSTTGRGTAMSVYGTEGRKGMHGE